MSQSLLHFQCGFGLKNQRLSFIQDASLPLLPVKSYYFKNCNASQLSFKVYYKLDNHTNLHEYTNKAQSSNGVELDGTPQVQTLSNFPKEELLGKVVLVRFESDIFLHNGVEPQCRLPTALFTIKYLHQAGAIVILVSSWHVKRNSEFYTTENVAEVLSLALGLEVRPAKFVPVDVYSQPSSVDKAGIYFLPNLFQSKGELSNCSKFSEQLSSSVDIFVNDAFSQSHKILASTVGITRFCSSCIAGFYFEECLDQMKNIIRANKNPFYAIIGGGNLVKKAVALKVLASRCDGLVFLGSVAYQIMHALGIPVPLHLVEPRAINEALSIVESAKSRNIPLILPKDFWCKKEFSSGQLQLFPRGWQPIDLGPKSVDEISFFLQGCKKLLLIGPVKFNSSTLDADRTNTLVTMLDNLILRDCEIIAVGQMACKAVVGKSWSSLVVNPIEDASTVWEFLKERKLPGLMALDRAYPFEIDWGVTYADPAQPLVVDIGSGNGMFIFKMAKKRQDWNFLGLEINGKLVNRCISHLNQSGMKNGYFIETNATSTFWSIISTYPGDLILVSIQCPNPDFNRPEQRWRMLQKSLVEAITDLLVSDGKVFIQSDIEAVALRMKEDFLKYGNGKLEVVSDQGEGKVHERGWLKENPFGASSDWEQHVLDRGAPMYRLLIHKIANKS
ncbi:hypothetical protein Leryth_000908 [Lithospermum erythrorhizon]|nr:hypothetical protein Leryth_000908 [Lithospermum erythrorhizon]